MDIKEIKKIREKYEFGNLNNSKGMETSVEMMYHVTVKIQNLLKTLYTIILCLVITNVFTLVGLVYRSVKNPYVPYVLRIDKDSSVNGQVLTGQQKLNINEDIIKYFLIDFIKKIRTVYKDRAYYQAQTKEKMSFVNNTTKSKIEDFINNKTNTEEVLKNQKSISVDIESCVKIDTNKFQINFTEKTSSSSGIPESVARYTAVVFLDFVPVTSEAMVRMNPLGIIIKDIEFSIVSPTQTIPQQVQPQDNQTEAAPPVNQ